METETQPPRRISHAALFLGFLQIGLLGFGGLAAISRHVIVDKRKWLNDRDYAALLGLCQALPGGNVVNVATVLIGDRNSRRPLGALAAVTGLFVMPLVLLTLIAIAFDTVSGDPDVMAGAAGACGCRRRDDLIRSLHQTGAAAAFWPGRLRFPVRLAFVAVKPNVFQDPRVHLDRSWFCCRSCSCR